MGTKNNYRTKKLSYVGTLTKDQKQNIIRQTAVKTGLPDYAVEKDAWVCIILQAVFQSK